MGRSAESTLELSDQRSQTLLKPFSTFFGNHESMQLLPQSASHIGS
jgi:hypothetical protein